MAAQSSSGTSFDDPYAVTSMSIFLECLSVMLTVMVCAIVFVYMATIVLQYVQERALVRVAENNVFNEDNDDAWWSWWQPRIMFSLKTMRMREYIYIYIYMCVCAYGISSRSVVLRTNQLVTDFPRATEQRSLFAQGCGSLWLPNTVCAKKSL